VNNYEYIIASLPSIEQDSARTKGPDTDAVLDEIRQQLGNSDIRTFDFLLEGFDGESLTEEFYRKAAAHRNSFIRQYFLFDLGVRNAKVRYLNGRLGRPLETDVVSISAEELEFEEKSLADAVLATDDILARERGIDKLLWNKVDEITCMDVFDIDVILGFAVKLKIVGRWLKLNPETGKELLRALVEEIRKNR